MKTRPSHSNRRIPAILSLAAATWLVTGAANAASITTLADANWEGTVISDPQGPANSGSLTSNVSPGGATADAYQDVSGVAAVRVDGGSANGQPGNSLKAISTWSETFTNTSGQTQSYDALLSIPQISLFFSGSGFGSGPGQQRNSYYSIILEIDGVTKFLSSALLRSGNAGHVLSEVGTDLGGIKDPGSIRYNFAPFSGTVNLGNFAAGDVFTAVYRIEAGIDIPGFEISADASIGDPLTVQGTGIQITSTVVPVPAAAGLFLAGLVSLGTLRRRRLA